MDRLPTGRAGLQAVADGLGWRLADNDSRGERRMHRRLPAEWEEQDAVLLAWPHAATDWADTLDTVAPVFSRIALAISRF